MDDYDWLLETTAWSDWSHSPADVKNGTVFDLNISRDLLRFKNWALDARFGRKKDNWKWTDFDGSYVYSSDDGFRDLTGTFAPEVGVSYQQRMTIPYIGAGMRTQFDPITINTYVLYSTWVKINDYDDHIYTETVFEAEIKKAEYIALGAGVSYAVFDNLFLNGRVDYQHIPEARGNMTILDKSTGISELTLDSAGIEHKATVFSIGATWIY